MRIQDTEMIHDGPIGTQNPGLRKTLNNQGLRKNSSTPAGAKSEAEKIHDAHMRQDEIMKALHNRKFLAKESLHRDMNSRTGFASNFKKIKDALEEDLNETKSTNEVVEVAIEQLDTQAPADVLQAIVEILGEKIDELVAVVEEQNNAIEKENIEEKEEEKVEDARRARIEAYRKKIQDRKVKNPKQLSFAERLKARKLKLA